ncbi:MAG: cytidylyltransferase domain-containing protein [Planctomycetaceae bacterium]
MRNLAIVQAIHLGSRRVPRKLLERLGEQTLLEIGLEKLKEVERLRGVPSLFAVSYEDHELREIVDAHGFQRVEIGVVAAEADSYATVFTAWTRELARDYDWVIDANVICRPFLRIETLLEFVDRALEAKDPFVACVRERGIVWNDRRQLLLGAGQVADTKNNPLYYRLAHLGYAHPANLWDEQGLAAAARPEAFSLLPEEQIDIDTLEDLAFARMVHAGQRPATDR